VTRHEAASLLLATRSRARTHRRHRPMRPPTRGRSVRRGRSRSMRPTRPTWPWPATRWRGARSRPQVRALDVELHDVVFMRDVAIARCLAPAP